MKNNNEQQMSGGGGKILPYSPGDFPELDNLSEGTACEFSGKGKIVKTQGTSEGGENEGNMGIEIDQIDFQPENDATRELKQMTGGNQKYQPGAPLGGGF